MIRPATIAAAQKALERGDLVIVPTDTVFGLAADAHNKQAVARLFALKQRPSGQPVSVLVSNEHMAGQYGMMDARAKALTARFWPGPLTLVVPLRPAVPLAKQVSGQENTIGLRVPDQAQTRTLIARFGRALATSSANIAGNIAPTRKEALASQVLEGAALTLEGVQGGAGASTVLKIEPERVKVLRHGALAPDALMPLLAPFGAAGRLV